MHESHVGNVTIILAGIRCNAWQLRVTRPRAQWHDQHLQIRSGEERGKLFVASNHGSIRAVNRKATLENQLRELKVAWEKVHSKYLNSDRDARSI